MPDVRREIALKGVRADDVYQAGLRALTAAGFEIWKARPLGWFVIARRQERAGVLEANLSVRGGEETHLSIGISGENVGDESLADVASSLLDKTAEQLAETSS
jgi:hypothetical protein